MSNPTDFPEPAEFASGGRVKAVLEPIVKASIIVPESASRAHSAPHPRMSSPRLPARSPRYLPPLRSHARFGLARRRAQSSSVR